MSMLPEVFIDRIGILLAITMPQLYVNMWLTSALFGIRQSGFVKRLLTVSFLPTIYMETMYWLLPLPLHLINSQLTLFFILMLLFKHQTVRKRLLILVVCFILFTVNDLGSVLIYSQFGSFSQFESSPIQYKIIAYWPVFGLFTWIGWILHKRKTAPIRWLADFTLSMAGRPTFYLVLLTTVQLFFMSYFYMQFIYFNNEQQAKISLYVCFFLLLFAIIVTFRIIAKTRLTAIQSTQKAYIDELNQMFATVRGQRHDFINHVQVMYTMLAMNKHEQLRNYMNEVVEEIRTVDKAHVDHPSPALAALVETKIAAAESKQIPFEYRIEEAPVTFGAITSIDLVRMIGNLIDNAFDASAELPPSERYVLLEMGVQRKMLHISVTNRGTVLTDAQKQAMIAPGFTTKNGEHSGLGLANVIARAAQYRGKVTIDSDEEQGVVVTIRLPDAGSLAAMPFRSKQLG